MPFKVVSLVFAFVLVTVGTFGKNKDGWFTVGVGVFFGTLLNWSN